MPAYVQAVPVRFRDVDALDHVNHAVVLTYCETVRCDWFASQGWPSMAGLPFILASVHVDYKAPIAKQDSIEVRMWVSRFGGKSWDFDYEVRHAASGKVYATVRTVQVAYDYKAGRSMPIGEGLKAKLQSIQAPQAAAAPAAEQ